MEQKQDKKQSRTEQNKRQIDVLKNVMQEDRQGKEWKGCNCRRNTTRAEEEETRVAQAKQHEMTAVLQTKTTRRR